MMRAHSSSPPRSRRRIWPSIVRMLLLLVAGVWLLSLLAVLVWEHRDTARPADAIVVLGAAQYVGRPSPVLRARLDHAVQLWHRGLAPRLVLTGGRGEGDTTSEAAVGRRYALRHGIPDSAILVETRGRTTSESMEQVAVIMQRQPARTVILVSDPFHMLRLEILARRFGLTPSISPTRTSPISANPGASLKYVLGESVKVPFTLLFERGE
ncbi:MAG TPA: YdcF family protein [Gemmatimonadaceae bacterium]|nr:YdcF family protein [Gemmatimonadaceae bacterium]